MKNLTATWFLRLRWIAFAGNALIFLWARYVAEMSLPILPIVFSLLCFPAGELMYKGLVRFFKVGATAIGLLLVWDTLNLTVLLYYSGGPSNPLSIVYLVHVVLAATLVGGLWPWFVAVLSSSCFALLFMWHLPVHELHHMGHSHHGMALHLKGMLFSYTLTAFLVAYFLGKILAEKEESDRKFRHLSNAQQRLAAMTALSTNAAHRLGTPLASLGLVSHELQQLLKNTEHIKVADLREDLDLFDGEVQRCKQIIQDLCAEAGNLTSEAPSWISLATLSEDIVDSDMIAGDRVIVEGALELVVLLQKAPVLYGVRALLNNALQATSDEDSVVVAFTCDSDSLTVSVKDAGIGMTADELERIREPFYSKKEGGMGLGVYIADLAALQLGGALTIVSSPGQGTTASLCVPVKTRALREAVA